MKPFAALLLVSTFLALPAEAQDVTIPNAAVPPATSPAPALGSDIVLVRVAGPWESAEQKGFSRLIARAAGGKLTLSVEWVSDDGKLVQALPLEAPEGAAQLPLSAVRSESGPEDSSVYFDTPEDAQGFRETFVLIVGIPGDARFGPATN